LRKNTSKRKKGPETETGSDPLTEFLREKARTLLQIAVEAEMEEFLQARVGVRNLEGKRTVVRNGYNPERTIQTGIGELSVRMPKVRDHSKMELSSILP
jgi:transposase-like protein